MGVFIPDTFALVRLGWQVAGDSETMVCTFGVSGPIDATADDIAALVHTALLTTACNPAQMHPVYVVQPTQVTLNDGGLSEGISGAPAPGTLAGASSGPPPNNCALLLTKYTARSGRKGRGRMYLPPFMIMEGNIDAAGYMVPADVASLTLRWTNFRTALIDAGVLPVLLHADELDPPNAITSWILQPQVATQRRRLR